MCAPKSKSSSQSEDVDGATSFKVVKFAAAPNGRCALAFVSMKGHPGFSGQEVGPLMVSEFHLAPNSKSGNSITANLAGPIGKVASRRTASRPGQRALPVAYRSASPTPRTARLENPNYNVGGVRVTTATDATNWTLKALGKDVVLHYTDDGQPLTKTFT